MRCSVFAYSFVIATIIGLAIKYTIGFRVSEDAEVEGIDVNEHAESAYEFDTAVRRAAASRPVT